MLLMKFPFLRARSGRKNKAVRRSLLLENLEERILWDASMDLVDEVDTADSTAETTVVQQASATPDNETDTAPPTDEQDPAANAQVSAQANAEEAASEFHHDPEANGESTTGDVASEQTDAEDASNPADSSTVATTEESTKEILVAPSTTVEFDVSENVATTDLVVVDSSIEDYESLVGDIRASSTGHIQIHIVDSETDGIEQVSELLTGYRDLEALHIVSHGDEAELKLGSSTLNSQNIEAYQESISQWRSAFSDGGDILLYGCNIAGNSDGEVLVEMLAATTGQDVAASVDDTGSSVLGGNFELEYASGDIEASLVMTESSNNTWQGVLVGEQASGTVTLPSGAMLDTDFTASFSFENTGTSTGFVPFSDFLIESGVEFDASSFSYLGTPLSVPNPPSLVATWDGAQWLDESSNPVSVHPLNRDAGIIPVPDGTGIGGLDIGTRWVVIEKPFGSFVPGQPAVNFTGTGSFTVDAVVGQPIEVHYRPGFVLGSSSTNGNAPSVGAWVTDTITPEVIQIEKSNDLPENETVTGPNFPATYTITVDVAGGEGVTNAIITDYLPANAVYRGDVVVRAINGYTGPLPTVADITLVSGVATTHDIDDFVGPNGDNLRLIVDLGTIADTDTVIQAPEFEIVYSVYFPLQNSSGADLISQSGSTNNDPTLNESTVTAIHDGNAVADIQDNDSVSSDGAVDDGDVLHDVHAISTQKSVENISSPDGKTRPNDILMWTVEFQVSDYFAFDDIELTDVLGDGMLFIENGSTLNPNGGSPAADGRFAGLEPTLTIVAENNVTAGNVDDTGTSTFSSNYTLTPVQNGSLQLTGETEILFDVSAQLTTANALSDGTLVGDLFAGDGGTLEGTNGASSGVTAPEDTSGLHPQRENNGTRGVLVFYSLVLENYEDADGEPVDQSVDLFDPLVNNADITGDSQSTDLSTDIGTKSEDTAASIVVGDININKSVHRINGTEVFDQSEDDTVDPGNSGQPSLDPDGVNPDEPIRVTAQSGDLITYRVRAVLPSADIENLKLKDFFPIPVHDVDSDMPTPTIANAGSVSSGGSAPDLSGATWTAGEILYGPDFNLHQIVGLTTSYTDPIVTIDTTNNSLTFDFGASYEEPNEDPAVDVVLDFYITLTVQDLPVNEEFLFTNTSQVLTDNSFGETNIGESIVFIEYVAPMLNITKGVVATSNTNATLQNPGGSTYVEPPVQNDGGVVDFSATTPGTSGNAIAFNGSYVNPAEIDTYGALNANALNVDGDDWVRYALTVQNEGGGEAHDVVVRDTLPQYNVGSGDGYMLPGDGSDPFDDGGGNFGINLQVYSGTGALLIGTTDFSSSPSADYQAQIVGGELIIKFNEDPSIQVLDGSRVENDINGSGTTPVDGDEVYIITYDLKLDNDGSETPAGNEDVIVGTTEQNAAIITQYYATADDPVDPNPGDDNDPTDPVRTNRGGDADGDGFIDAPNFDTADVSTPEPIVDKFLVNTEFTDESDATADNQLANPVDNGINNAREAVIGEKVKYKVTITIPEGQVPAAVLRDTLDPGLALVSIDKITRSSEDITLSGATSYADDPDQAGTDNLLVNGIDGSDVNVLNGVSQGGVFRFQLALGTINNTNTDNSVVETISIEYTAIVLNVPSNQSTLREGGPQLNNAAQLRWDGPDDNSNVGNGGSEQSNTDRANTINIIEPVLEVDKQVTVDGSGPSELEQSDGSDNITYTIVIRHESDSEVDAFDVNFSDVLPVELGGVSFSAVDNLTNDVSLLFQLNTGTLESVAPFDLLFGESITITVTGTLIDTETVVGELINNTASIDWSSLDGDLADGDLADDFVDTDLGGTGDFNESFADSERTGIVSDGPGGTVNDYNDSDGADIQISVPTVSKEIIATSVDESGNDLLSQATIGETVTYRVTLTIPEGSTPRARLIDNMNQGLEFVSLDLLKAYNSGVLDAGDGNPGTDDTAAAKMLSDGIAFNDRTYTAAVTGNSADPGGQTITINIGDLLNQDIDNNVIQTVVFEYTARVVNIVENQHGDALDNSAKGVWDPDGNINTDNDEETDEFSTTLNVVEPSVAITKDAEFEEAGTVPDFNDTTIIGDAGDDVYFKIIFTAAADRPVAHEVRLFDDLSALDDYVDFTTLGTNGVISVTDNLTAGAPLTTSDFQIVDLTLAGARLELVDASGVDMGPTEGVGGVAREITVIIGGTLRDYVNPEQVLNNQAGIEWTSLETPEDAPNDAGSDSNERTGPSGSDGNTPATNPPNDYVSTADDSVTVDTVVPVKTIVATSEAHTATGEHDTNDADVAVGEVVRYRLWVQVPEGTTEDLVIRDNLPDGLQFLNDDTSTVALLSDSATGLTSSLLSGSGLNVAGNNPATMASPTFALPDGSLSAAADSNDDNYSSGNDIYFKLGTILNTGDNDGPEFVVIEFNALVLNVAGNQDGMVLANTIDVFADNDLQGNPGDGSSLDEIQAGDNIGNTSTPINVEVVEPVLEIDKEVRIPVTGDTSGDAGDAASYVFTVTHTSASTADAFNLNIADDLPPEFDPSGVTADILNAQTDAFISSANSFFTVSGDKLETGVGLHLKLGEKLVITVTGTLDSAFGDGDGNTVDAGETVPNTVALNYSSLPGTGTPDGQSGNATGSSTPGSSGDGDGERDGSDDPNTNGLNNYFDGDSASFTVPEPTFSKVFANPGQGDVTIGEVVEYDLVVMVPEGLTRDVIIDDAIPSGMAALSVTVITQAGVYSPTTSAHLAYNFGGLAPLTSVTTGTGDGNDIRISLGNITNSGDNNPSGNNDSFVIRVRALVLDVAANDGLLDGTSPAADDQTDLTNTASMTFVDPDTPGTPTIINDPDDTDTTVEVIEPALQVIKDVHVDEDVAPTPPGNNYGLPGDDIYYVINISHTDTSTATAYDVTLEDVLPLAFDNATIDSVVDSASTLTTGDFAINSGTLQIAVGGDVSSDRINIDVGRTITVTLKGTIADAVNLASWHNNEVDITWSSIDSIDDGDETDLSPYIDDGTDSERGDDTDHVNDIYTDDDEAYFSVPDFDKTIVETSADHTTADQYTSAEDLTIGETVTYHLTATLPDDPMRPTGSGVPVVITDTLPNGLQVESVRIVSIGGDILSSTSGLMAGDTDAAAGISISGQLVTFDFGIVQVAHFDNGTDGSYVDEDSNRIVVEIIARVINTDDNQAGDVLTNDAMVDFNDPAAPPPPDGTNFLTDSEDVDVVKPYVLIDKTFYTEDGSRPLEDDELVDAGDILTVQLIVENTGSSTVFDMIVQDQLSDFFDRSYSATDATVEGGQPATFVGLYDENMVSTSFGLVTFSGGTLVPGETATLTFKVRVAQTVVPYETELNTAQIIQATTLPGDTNPGDLEGDVADPGDESYQGVDRDGNSVPQGVDDLIDDDTLQVNGLTIAKAFVSSNIPGTPDAPSDGTPDLGIGEIATYQFLITLPESTTSGLTLVDLVPEGMEYVPGTARLITDPTLLGETTPFGTFSFDGLILDAGANTIANGGLISLGVDGAFGLDTPANDIEITFGEITTNGTIIVPGDIQNNQFVIELQVVVKNVSANEAGDLKTNIGTVTVPGSTNPDDPEESNEVTVEIVEPVLELDKTFYNATFTNEVYVINAGDTVQVLLEVKNSGNGPAYDIVIEDPMNPALFNVAGAVEVSTPSGFTFSKTGNSIIYSGDGPVMPAKTLQFRFAVQTVVSLGPGELPNTAIITGGDSVPGDGPEERDYSGDDGFDNLVILPDPFPAPPPAPPGPSPAPPGPTLPPGSFPVLPKPPNPFNPEPLGPESVGHELLSSDEQDILYRIRQAIQHRLPDLPVDFIITGIAEHGSNITVNVYDENGVMVGTSSSLSDAAGNWLINFPSMVLDSSPHHVEVRIDPASYNKSTIGEFNTRAYYTPVLDAMHFASKSPSVGDAFRESAHNIVNSQHQGNLHPLGNASGDWNAPFEFLATSYTEKL
ncbi:MAG: hypothetical protein DHS20C01_00820 [marine bacterium B5-7]|nr:MAG: hypothetical protein DHS20C01_00820 [marine bacterium B5-7]